MAAGHLSCVLVVPAVIVIVRTYVGIVEVYRLARRIYHAIKERKYGMTLHVCI